MKTKNILLSIMVICLTFSMLVGCGGKNETSTQAPPVSDSDDQVLEEQSYITQEPVATSNTFTVGQAFTNKDKKVWYLLYDEVGKDAEIYYVFVVENGLVTTYRLNAFDIQMTLGEVSRNGDDWAIQCMEDYIDQENRRDDDMYYSQAEASFIGHTDSTGNTMEYESLIPGPGAYKEVVISGDYMPGGQVFDNFYSGFSCYKSKPSDGYYIVTENNGNNTYVLDARDSEYLSSWD